MSVSGIHGHLLEITVVGGTKLKDTEWISRQDPYVCLEYATTKFTTGTCKDGGRNPTFQEKFVFTLIEGLRELNIIVWNSNTLTYDDFIGSGKVQLHKVLSTGYDDSPWPIQTKSGRYAGEIRLIMHYAKANHPATNYGSAASSYAPQVSMYSASPASAVPYPPTGVLYPKQSTYSSYPPDSAAYPPHLPHPYPPTQPFVYHHQSYAPPPSLYPPPPHHPPQASPYFPSGPFPGIYPPPPY